MRSIASLASDSPASKRRKRGNEGTLIMAPLLRAVYNNWLTYMYTFIEDTFGADDEDWMVYREIVSALNGDNCHITWSNFINARTAKKNPKTKKRIWRR